ncbi:MAG: ligase-associated DNA damage response exonuclease, partial [Isosphaeraceae bacterium]
ITHAHADHARWGHRRYLTSSEGLGVLRQRMRADATILPLPYGQAISHGGVQISLHPAGHVLGSAQVRMEYRGRVAVVTGDYKVEADRTCTAFEPVKCHMLVSESTFALPIYRWQPQAVVFNEINQWWRANQQKGLASVIMAYSLGKSQRVLAGIDPTIGPIYSHGAVEPLNRVYRECGISLPPTSYVSETLKESRGQPVEWSKSLVIAPPSAAGTPWLRRFEPHSCSFVSGWMTIRGTRRRQSLDRGFVLSDHADWPGLLWAIHESQAEEVWLTHGYSATLARFLTDQGLRAFSVDTRFTGEADVTDTTAPADAIDPETTAPAEEQAAFNLS